MFSKPILKLVSPFLLSTATLLLAGCGMAGSSLSVVTSNPVAPGSPATPTTGMSGQAHGGYYPVVGATAKVWYPGVTGYGSTGGTLATTTTTAGGAFQFGSFTCPASDLPLYIVVTGGNPGLANGTNNTYIALAAYIGPCSGANALTGIVINEATTAALVFSTAQFTSASQAGGLASGAQAASYLNGVTGTTAANGLNIGAPVGTLSGSPLTLAVTNTQAYTNLKNAFATSLNLADPFTGQIGPTSATNITNDTIGFYSTTIKMQEISSILAACVQTTGNDGTCAGLANYGGTSGTGGTSATATGVTPGQSGSTTVIGCGGTSSTSTATGTVTLNGTSVQSIAPNAAGAGYGTQAFVNIVGGGGSGATATATISSGTITAYNVTNGGTGYTSNPTVTVSECALPTDTMQIALYMALSPATNVTKVFTNYIPSQPPYGSAQSYAPFDWTLAITYNGLPLSAASGSSGYSSTGGYGFGLQGPAIDSTGNIWVAGTNNGLDTLYGFTAGGQPLVTAPLGGVSYYGGANATAIDASGNIWTTNDSGSQPAGNSITEFTPTPSCLTNPAGAGCFTFYRATSTTLGSTLTVCGPNALTMDQNYNFFFDCFKQVASGTDYPLNALLNTGTTSLPNYGTGYISSPTTVTSTTSPAAGSASNMSTLNGGTATAVTTYALPNQIASDSNGNIWVPVASSGTTAASIQEWKQTTNGSPSTMVYTPQTAIAGSSSNTSSGVQGVVVDHSNNIWWDSSLGELNEAAAAGTTLTTSCYGGGVNNAAYMAMDGAGDVWIADASAFPVTQGSTFNRYYVVTEFNNACKPFTPNSVSVSGVYSATGGYPHNFGQPKFLAVDGSGNVWVPNYAAPAPLASYSITANPNSSYPNLITFTLAYTSNSAYTPTNYAAANYVTLFGFTGANAFLNGISLEVCGTGVTDCTTPAPSGSGTSGSPYTFTGYVLNGASAPVTTGSVTATGLATIGTSANPPNITEVVGAAVPVFTPLAIAPAQNKLSVLP